MSAASAAPLSTDADPRVPRSPTRSCLLCLAGRSVRQEGELVRLRGTSAAEDKVPGQEASEHQCQAHRLNGVCSHDVVLLHGQPGSGADWQQVIRRLPAALRAVAPDRPGYGASRLPPGGFAVNARAIIDDLDNRGIERAVLVGHSYGGGVALTAAALAPERVAGLVLLATVGPGCLNGWDWLLASRIAGPVCAVSAWHLTPWLARASLRLVARNGADAAALQHYVNWYVWGHTRTEHGSLWRTFLTEQRVIVRESDDLATVAPAVRVPALLMADPDDTTVPIQTATRLERLLPDAHLSLIEGAGHHLPLRVPGRVADAIAGFVYSLG